MSSPNDAMETMIQNLKEKTGKTLDEWLKFMKTKSFSKHGEMVSFLKKEQGVTHGYANLIAHKTLKSDALSLGSETDLVADQYSGAKSSLRSIYDKIISRVQKFGSDVDISPKKTYVSLRRKKQFAIIRPSTSTRIDVGINLKGEKTTDRLEASGSFNTMVSHHVRIENEKQVDSELESWLKKAYENAG
jgi:predicted transport protein